MSLSQKGLQKAAIAATILLMSAAGASASSAVANRNLNLRTGPGPAFHVIAVMPQGATVEVQRCNEEWCRVKYRRRIGYASRVYLEPGTESHASTTAELLSAPENAKPTLTGPRIWRWRDAEWRDRHWRRLGWHNRL
jgi:uncharacterized protein YraI